MEYLLSSTISCQPLHKWSRITTNWLHFASKHRDKIIIFHTQAKILICSPKTVVRVKKACSVCTFVLEPYIFFVKQLDVTFLISQCKVYHRSCFTIFVLKYKHLSWKDQVLLFPQELTFLMLIRGQTRFLMLCFHLCLFTCVEQNVNCSLCAMFCFLLLLLFK
jgi:hypothetical protein